MNHQRNAADRVRPFLQAMEQSIAAARQRRLNKPSPVQPVSPPEQPGRPVSEEDRPRLRARPKRPSFIPSYDASSTVTSHPA